MTAPVLATWDGSSVCLDGEPCKSLPRSHWMAQREVYAVGPFPWADVLRSFGKPGDFIAGPRPGSACSLTVGGQGGGWTIQAGDTWGLSHLPDVAREELQELRNAADRNGLPWKSSPGSMAGGILRKLVPRAQLRQLRPRWRWLAASAQHAGPMVATRAHAAHAVELDLRTAYLRSMSAPVPVPGTWASAAHLPVRALLGCEGLAYAKVRLRSLPDSASIGPLGTEHLGCQVHPHGEVVNVWTLRRLREVVAAGLGEVETVYDAAVCQVAPLLAPVAERIEAVDYKPLRRLLYTRLVGRLASRGWYVGTVEEPDGGGKKRDGLFWRFDGEQLLSNRHRHDYRPDWSAHVLADTAEKVHRLIGALRPGSVAYAHLDAVWTDDPDGEATADSLMPGAWKVKGEGELRVWAVGNYRHNDRLALAGVPAWEAERKPPERVSFATAIGRRWNVSPCVTPWATSVNIVLHQHSEGAPVHTADTSRFTSGGWSRP